MKRLIVNADDFGLSAGVNRGIVQAHESGIVTSASLMVRAPAVKEAATMAGNLSVGLHLDLCEWEYRDEQWQLKYSVVPVDDVRAVSEEVGRQLDVFHLLMGRNPTHLDSHQHIHRDEPVRSVLLEAGHRLNVPVRHFHPQIRYCGKFYGQSDKGYPYPEGISIESLLAVLCELPNGVTELGCHPAAAADSDSCYRDERVLEMQTLCNPRVGAALRSAAIELCSFRDVTARV
jgi:chitin disaccharide deacetylase